MRSRYRVASTNCSCGAAWRGSSVMRVSKCSKYLIAIAVHHIVRLEHFAGQNHIAENQCAQAAAQHSANGAGHRFEIARRLGHVHSRQRNHALGNVDGQVADALQVIGNFLGGDHAADFLVIQQPGSQHSNGMVVDQDFHFIDARLHQKYFAGKLCRPLPDWGAAKRRGRYSTLLSTVRAMEIR